METTRIFQPGTADQEQLLALLELLLNEQPPATATTQTACADSHESSPVKSSHRLAFHDPLSE
jgi:hypothetical protein